MLSSSASGRGKNFLKNEFGAWNAYALEFDSMEASFEQGGDEDMTRSWRVYGVGGHRQRESFNSSQVYDWTEGDSIRRVEIENADRTGTNEYTIIRITRNTPEECEEELRGQISDGVFENSKVGDVVEIL